MFDIGWSELLIIGVVALIVVGPRDLPKMFRTLGQVTGRLRGMAREFTRAMEAAADESGVKDMARTFRETASGRTLREAAGFDEIEKEFRDIGVDRPATRPAPGAQGAPKPAPGPRPDPRTEAGNAALGETEAERLKRAERAAEARRQAAEIRARREAEAKAAAAPPPAAAPNPKPPADPQG